MRYQLDWSSTSILKVFILCVSVICLHVCLGMSPCMSVHHMHVELPGETGRDTGASGDGVRHT